MKKFIYYTKQGKFETDNYDEIPWDDLHSPNDETPAYIEITGMMTYKEWCFEGKLHRLTGPAIIFENGKKYFYLYGKRYFFLVDWLVAHPNQDIGFQTKMILQYT